MDFSRKLLFFIASVLSIAVQSDSVSVNAALCPTNKIAPHRRVVREQNNSRTLGLIYSLLTPSRPRPQTVNDYEDLVEKPQEDDPDDCGEIEDYDETDLSSIVPGALSNIYYKNRENQYLFGDNHIIPPYYSLQSRPGRPPQPPSRPSSSYRPQRPPTRPPFSSGGTFVSNMYRPPTHSYPSSHIKPVQENTYDSPQEVYRPGVVGGALAHVVGFPLKRRMFSDDIALSKRPNNPIRFPENDSYKKRHARAKETNVAAGIIRSFVDFIFK